MAAWEREEYNDHDYNQLQCNTGCELSAVEGSGFTVFVALLQSDHTTL